MEVIFGLYILFSCFDIVYPVIMLRVNTMKEARDMKQNGAGEYPDELVGAADAHAGVCKC
jgi:hypothetical protein